MNQAVKQIEEGWYKPWGTIPTREVFVLGGGYIHKKTTNRFQGLWSDGWGMHNTIIISHELWFAMPHRFPVSFFREVEFSLGEKLPRRRPPGNSGATRLISVGQYLIGHQNKAMEATVAGGDYAFEDTPHGVLYHGLLHEMFRHLGVCRLYGITPGGFFYPSASLGSTSKISFQLLSERKSNRYNEVHILSNIYSGDGAV